MKRVTARTAHEIPDRAPLQLTVGDEVQAGVHDSEWPELVFVTAARTTELPTRVGEVLDVLAEDVISGWLWCRSSSGRQGWVPVRTVEDDR